MRYVKGSVILKLQDRELLHLVADAQYVTHSQLFQLTRLKTLESKREIFNWRTRRLTKNGLLRKHVTPYLDADVLYSVTPGAIAALERMGITYLGGYVEPGNDPQETLISHALEINEIRLALERSGILVSWTSEAFIRVLNLCPTLRYAKTYDAVVRVNLSRTVWSEFAIEYERSLKTEERYDAVVKRLADEKRLGTILYLASSYEVAAALRRYFQDTRQNVLLALVWKFEKELLDTQVDVAGSHLRMSLREALVTRAVGANAKAVRVMNG